jgi:choline dehydrogenase
MAWNFYVHHYDEKETRDTKYVPEEGGVLYPRAGTLGGCTAHNAMITIVAHDSDWDDIAERTGDRSWHSSNMWQYFQRLENCTYRRPMPPPESDPSGHGFSGWLTTSLVSPFIALGDSQVVKTVFNTVRSVIGRWGFLHWVLTGDDPNDRRNRAATTGMATVPLATTREGRRNGTREFIRSIHAQYPDRLTLAMNTLVTRVVFDREKRAVGVDCRAGNNLYGADPNATSTPGFTEKQYRCSREVILAGGAFNTPQLLMLSGIGPKEHLGTMGIECLVDRPGVGSNLQDRYEVGVVSQMKRPFEMLADTTFLAPENGAKGDLAFQAWERGEGLYTSNGAMAAMILKSAPAKTVPDLFIFSIPGDFHGYYPGYSTNVTARKDHLTWAIVKAHTKNTAGTVRLRSKNPLDPPDIRFHYFEEGNDTKGEDLDAVVKAIQTVRRMNAANDAILEELIPGKKVGDDQLRTWVEDNAWGHHASCSCKIGRHDDREAVVDSRFRVIGTKGLRIVDASVFPRIPGFFIVTPIYMVSEKAADVITEDAG